jgi:hypothetical protein
VQGLLLLVAVCYHHPLLLEAEDYYSCQVLELLVVKT